MNSIKQVNLHIVSIEQGRIIFVCNISPEEMIQHKDEIEKYCLGDYNDPWEFEWLIDLSTAVMCSECINCWKYNATII